MEKIVKIKIKLVLYVIFILNINNHRKVVLLYSMSIFAKDFKMTWIHGEIQNSHREVK